MGEVYRADDLTLDHPVALKFLPERAAPDAEGGSGHDAAQIAQFHNELRTARQVSHKNVCRLYDLGEADHRRFLTMEYVDGEDLASLLRRIGRLPAGKAIEIARQLCAGLAAAHERGVIHRDLKPNNWTLIVSSIVAQKRYDPNNHNEIWGAYEYKPDKDVVRAKMTVARSAMSTEELTWGFADVTDAGGKLVMMWDKDVATVPFTVGK